MDVTLSQPQHEAFAAAVNPGGSRYIALVSGIGAGKSFVGGLASATHAMQSAGGVGMIVAPTETMVRTIAVPEFLKWLPRGTVKRHNQTNKEIELVNGYMMYYRSTEIPDNLRGPNCDWIWADEAALLTEEAAKILNGRLRVLKFQDTLRMLFTTTPRGHNWIWDWFEKEPREEYQIIKMKTRDNYVNLAKGTVEALEQAYTGQWAQQELEGEFVSFEGLVWSQWDERTHLGKPSLETDFRHVVCGVDFGWTHPTVMEVLGLDWDGRVWLLHEYAQPHTSNDMLVAVAQELVAEYGVNFFACDWASPEAIAQMKVAGLPADKANKDVLTGIRAVGRLLETGLHDEPLMHVSPQATLLRKQIPGYVWMPVRGKLDTWHDMPKKEADDAPDALRYAAMALESFLDTEATRPAPKARHVWFGKHHGHTFRRVG